MTGPRYFVLTGGNDAAAAIDFVEAQGHRVIRRDDVAAARLVRACSIPVYGICEIEPPGEPERP